ncbi:MAG: molybdenum cofactor biosynthesis protein MoaE [Deltaproteobacteria bacterium]|nr:molybdenum cofactor biosynthesis protein MoaE [Deltaproteobacteria bacterium]
MVVLTDEKLKVQPLVDWVRRDEAGAVIVFEGVTRNHHDGRGVVHLEYEAYGGMAEAEMTRILNAAHEQWPDVQIAMAHRVGVVGVGDASVVIAVSAPHRDTAYAASRFSIDSLKASVPIWKKEVYADGSVWKANSEGQGNDG